MANQNTDVIDITALQSDQSEAIEMNGTANAFARSTPLHDDRYRAILQAPSNPEDMKNMLHGKTFQSGENKGKPWFKVDFEVKIMEYFDPQKDSKELLGKQRTFSKSASTIVRHVDGQATCEVATLLTNIGYIIKGMVTQKELIKALMDALAQRPQIGVVTEISARYDSGEPSLDRATGKPLPPGNDGKARTEWKTQYRGERNFPKNPDGSVNYSLPPVALNDGKTANPFVSADIVDYFRVL